MLELDIKNLDVQYRGGAKAITSFNLKGEGIFALVGYDKAGKTTLLRSIAGLQKYSGDIFYDGKNLKDIPFNERNTMMIFEDYALFPEKTLFYNLAYPLEIRGIDKTEIQRRVIETARFFDIESLLDIKAKKLNINQKRLAAISRLPLRKSALYLIDNPLKGMENKERKDLFIKLKQLIECLGGTVIYATDEPVEAAALTKNIYVLNFGYTKQTGDVIKLYNKPESLFVAEMFDKINVYKTELLMSDGVLGFDFCGRYMSLPEDYLSRLITKEYIGREVLFAFRPDAVEICEDGIPAEVLNSILVKDFYQSEIKISEQKLIVYSDDILENNVKIAINVQNICIFDFNAEVSVLKD